MSSLIVRKVLYEIRCVFDMTLQFKVKPPMSHKIFLETSREGSLDLKFSSIKSIKSIKSIMSSRNTKVVLGTLAVGVGTRSVYNLSSSGEQPVLSSVQKESVPQALVPELSENNLVLEPEVVPEPKMVPTDHDASKVPIPRVIHQVLSGDAPPLSMFEFAKYTSNEAVQQHFEHKLWRDKDAERLVKEEDAKGEIPGLLKAWEHIKNDTSSRRFAKMSDFMRALIMWSMGGIYLDDDVIFCESIEFLVEKPGMVSFPLLTDGNGEVNGSMLSAPPRHPLMKHTLEYLVELDSEITHRGNLYAGGSYVFGLAFDKYIKETGIDIPPLSVQNLLENKPIPGKITLNTHEFFKFQIADLRFGGNPKGVGVFHLEYRSWQPQHTSKSGCIEKPELIQEFIHDFCAKPNHDRFSNAFHDECGLN